MRQIDESNIGRLGLAWSRDLGTHHVVQGTPIVVNGVMYNVSTWNITTALDAATGAELWAYDPQVPRDRARYACCGLGSRGLAFWRNKVLLATLDGRLIALDARTGRPVWSVHTFDVSQPYTITGAPRAFDGKVIIGNAGSEFGVRGYVSAYDAENGKLVWRFFTVPGDPSRGFESAILKRAAETWRGEWWRLGGGGTVWDSIVYDAALRRIYIGTDNGTPWAQFYRSPGGGDNLFLASIVALDADTGEYVWHYQTVPSEKWDFNATAQMILADLVIGGRKRKVLMQAPKNGFFYIIDREDGRLISARKFAPNNWASHIDLATGRPVLLPTAEYDGSPQLMTPAPIGAHGWHPMSYSPLTGLVYFPVRAVWSVYELQRDFVPREMQINLGVGGSSEGARALWAAAPKRSEWLVAWNPATQREVWRAERGACGSCGVLVTEGGIVLQGSASGEFVAYRASTGERIWSTPIHSIAAAGPISYEVRGKQFVAVNATWIPAPETKGADEPEGSGGRLLAFTLGRKAISLDQKRATSVTGTHDTVRLENSAK